MNKLLENGKIYIFLKSSFQKKKKKNTCLPYFSKQKLNTTTHSFQIAANIEHMGIRNYPLLPGKNANKNDALFW